MSHEQAAVEAEAMLKYPAAKKAIICSGVLYALTQPMSRARIAADAEMTLKDAEIALNILHAKGAVEKMNGLWQKITY